MSRELKFMAWHRELKKMLNVYVIDQTRHAGEEYCGICKGYYLINNQVTFTFDEVDWIEYTGLKDKTGKKIYEGDIVMWHGGGAGNENKIGDVYYEDAVFKVRNYFLGFLDNPSDAFGEGLHTIRVIGNIYSNPELLK